MDKDIIVVMGLLGILVFSSGCLHEGSGDDEDSSLEYNEDMIYDLLFYYNQGNYDAAISLLITEDGDRIEEESENFTNIKDNLVNEYGPNGEELLINGIRNLANFSEVIYTDVGECKVFHYEFDLLLDLSYPWKSNHGRIYLALAHFIEMDEWGILIDKYGNVSTCLNLIPLVPQEGDIEMRVFMSDAELPPHPEEVVVEVRIKNTVAHPLVVETQDSITLTYKIIAPDGSEVGIERDFVDRDVRYSILGLYVLEISRQDLADDPLLYMDNSTWFKWDVPGTYRLEFTYWPGFVTGTCSAEITFEITDDVGMSASQGVVIDYYLSMDEGDYERGIGYEMFNNGSFIKDNPSVYDQRILDMTIRYGENGELIEIIDLETIYLRQERLNNYLSRYTRYWYTVQVVINDSGIKSYEHDLQVYHFEIGDRWGFCTYDEVEYDEYPITSMIDVELLSAYEGSSIHIENIGGNEYEWDSIRILLDDVPIEVYNGTEAGPIWNEGICTKDLYLGEHDIQTIAYLCHSNGSRMHLQTGGVHKVSLYRLKDDLLFWEKLMAVEQE